MSNLIRRAFRMQGVGGDVSGNLSIDTYTGNGTSQSIVNGLDLASGGLVWGKLRDASRIHMLVDTERGSGFRLSSDSTAINTADGTVITSFNSDGFSVGASNGVNQNTGEQVTWSFKKAEGFLDIINYGGDSISGRAIPHSLGTPAGLSIVKCTTLAFSWQVQHTSRPATTALILENNQAEQVSSVWNNTAMTGTEVSLGGSNLENGAGQNYIMYVFAHNPEKGIYCGQYNGTGAAGNQIALGWKPKYVMIKAATGTSNWSIWDTERGSLPRLSPNLADAEQSFAGVDFNSIGFELNLVSPEVNGSGIEYVFMAIKE